MPRWPVEGPGFRGGKKGNHLLFFVLSPLAAGPWLKISFYPTPDPMS
jgi:hypothetical protein